MDTCVWQAAECQEPTRQQFYLKVFLESSNIDAVSELVGSMEDQRQFEINIKLISLSKEIDEGGSSLMKLPG